MRLRPGDPGAAIDPAAEYGPRLRRVLASDAGGEILVIFPLDLDGNRRARRRQAEAEPAVPHRTIPWESLERLADDMDKRRWPDGDEPQAPEEVLPPAARRSRHGRAVLIGLRSLPFTKNLDPDDVLEVPVQTRALERLRFLVERKGIGVLVGAPGCGKSTVLRERKASLGKTSHSVCYLHQTTWARVDLYREMARSFGLEPRYRNSDVLRERDERLLTISRQERIRPVRYHSQCWSPFRHQTECCT